MQPVGNVDFLRDDPEVRNVMSLVPAVTPTLPSLVNRLAYFSDWHCARTIHYLPLTYTNDSTLYHLRLITFITYGTFFINYCQCTYKLLYCYYYVKEIIIIIIKTFTTNNITDSSQP